MWTLKLKLIVISSAVLLAIAAFSGYTYYIYKKGQVYNEDQHVLKETKAENKVYKQNEKIDKQTPYTADKSVAIEWLYNHAGR